MKIYVVSLKNSCRRKKILEQAKKYKLEIIFFDAVEGKTLGCNYINEINQSYWVKEKYQRVLGNNEIGCSLSHRRIYEKIVEDNKAAIILEDDVFFDDKLKKLSNSDSEFMGDDLYILGGQEGLESNEMIIRMKHFELIKIHDDINFSRVIFSDKYIYRTCCYIMTPSLAKKILSFTKTNFCVADDWLNLRKSNIIRKIYLSDIVSHPDELFTSTIENERKIKDTFWKNSYPRKFLREVYKNIRNIVASLL